jgi:hypothetical protein
MALLIHSMTTTADGAVFVIASSKTTKTTH